MDRLVMENLVFRRKKIQKFLQDFYVDAVECCKFFEKGMCVKGNWACNVNLCPLELSDCYPEEE